MNYCPRPARPLSPVIAREPSLPSVISAAILLMLVSGCIKGGLQLPQEQASLQNSSTSEAERTTLILDSIDPSSGSSMGGNTVKFRGQNFRPTTVILVDNQPCPNMNYISKKEITCAMPSHLPNTVSVEVRNLRTKLDGMDGIIQASLPNSYTYIASSAPPVVNASIGGGRSTGGLLIMDAVIGEPAAATVGSTTGIATGSGITLKAGSRSARE